MRSLKWKLGGALLLVVVISVGIMAYLTNLNTTNQFNQYVQGGGLMYTQRVSDSLGQYYSQGKTWNGVQEILNASLRSNSDRLVLADNSGKIVGDTSNQWLGKSTKELSLNNGTSIVVSNQTVGTLYPFLTGTGRGYMGGMGMMGGSGTPVQSPENNFLSQINGYLWIAGLLAIIVALLLGIFLTRQIIRPISGLTTGATHIAAGDLSYRVKIHSNDEIGNLAKSFNSMAANLDNSEQSRKRLVSDVAHELRTPLTIIEGTVDGIIDGVFLPDAEHLDTIKEQTTMLSHLINDLRDISMAESGQLKLDILPTDIVELAHRKLSQFEASAKSKNIRLIMDAPPDIPELRVDARRIEQVIANLLSNAIRHTPEGGLVTISLKVDNSNLKNAKPALIISVSDTGEGIPAEHLPHLFERFYRVETSRSRKDGGAGLGLAIVKQMVQAHGGQVWVESKQGHGSTFFICLPR